MQIKGKFSATRANFVVYVSACCVSGDDHVALRCCGLREREREKRRMTMEESCRVRKLETCVE